MHAVLDVQPVAAMAGAVCLQDATGLGIPSPLQGQLDSFSGAFVECTHDAWEIAGVGALDDDLYAPVGCFQQDTTYCEDNGRPAASARLRGDDRRVRRLRGCRRYACL